MSKPGPVDKEHAVYLPQDEMPTHWYNILADLPEQLPPPLAPGTLKPMSPEPLLRLSRKKSLCRKCRRNVSSRFPTKSTMHTCASPDRRRCFERGRLEKFLNTPAEIYYKCEYVNPMGSHKPNTAIAQAYYNMVEGTKRLVTETGAGQWGSALAMASAIFGLKCSVYMVRASYDQKPGRRTMMETMGADVVASPSKNTKYGKSVLESDPNNTGSLGMAISEAIEDCVSHEDTKYCLGSVLNHVLLHQTIIGQEAKKQFEMIDVTPDLICGCIGGGSNFAGFAYPFMADKLKGKSATKYVACEPKAVPSTTRRSLHLRFRRHRRDDTANQNVHGRTQVSTTPNPRRRTPLPWESTVALLPDQQGLHEFRRLLTNRSLRSSTNPSTNRRHDNRARNRARSEICN